jgi:putative glycosyltransferase (TIGR04372 family)
MGLTDTHRYICFIVRDAAFKSQAAGRRDWSHHNYRDNDIQTFQTAAVALAEKGYWVFRMGKIVQGKLHAEHPRIIDYANSPFRDDFLDIWLTANCLYAVTTGTGLDEVCTVFRRGYVHVNQIPVGGIRSFTPSIVSFKHLKWKSSGRYLSLREQIETGLVYALHSHKYNDAGVEIVNNTSEEILAAVMEYDAWQQGTLTEHPEDRELQERFWRILEEWPAFARYHGVIRAQVSHCFLQKNHSWFLA